MAMVSFSEPEPHLQSIVALIADGVYFELVQCTYVESKPEVLARSGSGPRKIREWSWGKDPIIKEPS